MRCDLAREAISSRLDGELPPLDDVALDAHLASCSSCNDHARALAGLHRSLRVRAAEPVPDLTHQIMAATAERLPTPGAAATPKAGVGVEWARYGLFTVAMTQLILALPLLVIEQHSGSAQHHTRELGAFGVALAVGMLVAAWQPERARGLLPMAGALAAGLLATAIADGFAGNSPIIGEAPHLLDLVGVVLLWRLASTSPTPTAQTPANPAAA